METLKKIKNFKDQYMEIFENCNLTAHELLIIATKMEVLNDLINFMEEYQEIPRLEIGQQYKGRYTGRIFTVYFNAEKCALGLKLPNKKENPSDCKLHMFEWENMILIRRKFNGNNR